MNRGYFEDQRLIPKAGLNRKARETGQVGGVYTDGKYRKKGIAQKVMRALHDGSLFHHGLTKLILFTGENNVGAQKLYESLGYEKVGYFGMIFSN